MQLFRLALFAAAASALALEQLDVDWEVSEFTAQGSTTSFHIKGVNFETDCKAHKPTRHNLLATFHRGKCEDPSVTFSQFPLYNEAQSWVLAVGYNGVAAKAIASSTGDSAIETLDLPTAFKLTENRP